MSNPTIFGVKFKTSFEQQLSSYLAYPVGLHVTICRTSLDFIMSATDDGLIDTQQQPFNSSTLQQTIPKNNMT